LPLLKSYAIPLSAFGTTKETVENYNRGLAGIAVTVYDGAAQSASCFLHENPFGDHRDQVLSLDCVRFTRPSAR